jgi:hypothetical protein
MSVYKCAKIHLDAFAIFKKYPRVPRSPVFKREGKEKGRVGRELYGIKAEGETGGEKGKQGGNGDEGRQGKGEGGME